MTRWIAHADLDAFYASVEQLDDPSLRGRPVVVGGRPESRGVVAAASYEARRFGVRSAMPMSRALRLCPQVVRVSPRFDRYHELSRQVMAVFRSVTPLIEPLSLDEAFLDVTEAVPAHGGPEGMARHLKASVRQSTGLVLSVGIGSNKTVAKIASDLGKPDGLVVVGQGEEASFLAPLPVGRLWGVGPKTAARLETAGVTTVARLAGLDATTAERLLGSRGQMLVAMAGGRDNRRVETARERKSVSSETTFARDVADGPDLRRTLGRLTDDVAAHLARSSLRARTVTLKARYSDFRTVTRSLTPSRSVSTAVEIGEVIDTLMNSLALGEQRLRLVGVQCSNLTDRVEAQAALWDALPAVER